jgi:hypothetical protein
MGWRRTCTCADARVWLFGVVVEKMKTRRLEKFWMELRAAPHGRVSCLVSELVADPLQVAETATTTPSRVLEGVSETVPPPIGISEVA